MMFRLLARESLRRRQPSSLLVVRSLVTSKQKRALQESQIHGETKTTTSTGIVPPPPPPPPTIPTATPKSASSGSSGSSSSSSSAAVVPIVAALAAGAAGVYYYYYTTTQIKEESGVVGSVEKSVIAPANDAGKTTDAPSKDEEKKKSSSSISKDDDSASSSAAQKQQLVPKEGGEATTTTTTTTAGNRVTQIPATAKMRHSAAVDGVSSDPPADDSPDDHPEAGHRVAALLPEQRTKGLIIETSVTDAAIAALQKETSVATARALVESHGNNLALTTIQELDDMKEVSQLKAKILQLSCELQDRTKWEAVRLKEFLVMKEKEVAEKYLEIVQKQRLEMEDLMAKRLREKEHEMATSSHRALVDKENGIQSVVEAALAAQEAEHEADKQAYQEIVKAEVNASMTEAFSKQLDEIRRENGKRLEEKSKALKDLSAKLQHLELALATSTASKQGSNKAHRLSAAALALSEKLETSSQAAATELAALQQAAGGEGVIATACATIPPSVATTGVPTLAELQARFEKVAKKCRQALLVPQGVLGLEGQLAGMVMASVTYPPTDAGNTAEHQLQQARELVAQGFLEEAIGKLEALPGQAKFVSQDWLRCAIDRVAVEKALKVIKMECTLLNESCLVDDDDDTTNTP